MPPQWDIRIVDEAVAPADLDVQADFIAITGKISQRSRACIGSRPSIAGAAAWCFIGGCFASPQSR